MPTVRELRLKLGWTQDDLAREAGVSSSTISHIENDKPVNPSTRKLILQALRVQTGEVSIVVKSRVGRSAKP